MAYSKELGDIVSLLMMTEYRSYIDKIKKLTASSLNASFKEVMINRFKTLINVSSGVHRKFLIEYLRAFEFENMMKIISEKLSLGPLEELNVIPLGIESVNYDELLRSGNLEELIGVLRGYDPYSDMRDEIVKRFIKDRNLVLLEYEFYRLRYSRLLELIHNFAFISVRELLRKFIGIEIDILNIYAVTGAMLYDFSPELIQLIIIPGGYLLNKNKLTRIIYLKKKSEIINALKEYSDIVKSIINKNETKAYLLAQKKLRKEILREMIPNYVSFLDVFICLKLIEFEYRDLTQIVYGVEYNIPRETLQRNLISYSVISAKRSV